jgi:sialate O-acetylesterase
MIIQRDVSFPLWSRKKVSVAFLGKSYDAQNKDGKWLTMLDPVQAGGPFSMNITGEDGCVTIDDIYAGDVWLCAGQSNMELQMQRLRDDYSEEWHLEKYPLIRQFKVPQESEFSGPRDELGGVWTSASAQTLHEFSGTAWFFAKRMYEKCQVPIGLVSTAWGGTPVESWMSEDALSGYPEKIAMGKQYSNAAFREAVCKKSDETLNAWYGDLNSRDIGLTQGWQKAENGQWTQTVSLPGDFCEAGLKDFCGVIWLHREFEVSEELAQNEARLWLGTIVDSDTVYVNGVEVGNTGYRYPPRKYTVPAGLLHEGKNRVVIRVICNNGEGGVTKGKPFRIFSSLGCTELAGNWQYRVGVETRRCPEAFFIQRQPMGNYNAMIAPVLKHPLKGVIWYQGESNDPSPNEYSALFQLMVKDWRKKNANEELPFLFVQLPIFGVPSDNDETSSWAVLREAQKEALSLPVTGMAAALDLGEWNDLHPLNKKDVGERLFAAAEKTLFKTPNTSPGPLLISCEKRREKLILRFDNCGGGLTSRGCEAGGGEAGIREANICEAGSPAADDVPHVSVSDNGQLVRLPAKIEGADTVSIDLSSLKNPQKVLYAWANNPKDRQLYNSEGLPAIPFRVQIKENDDV